MHSTNEYGTKQRLRVSAVVMAALLAGTAMAVPAGAAAPVGAAPAAESRRFDVVVDQMPARDFFMTLMDGSKKNILISPDVSGSITLRLNNVTIEEALRAVSDSYGYDYVEAPYGYQISSNSQNVRVFPFNYLNALRSGRSETTVSGRSVERTRSTSAATGNGSSTVSGNGGAAAEAASTQIATRSDIDFWKDLQATLTQIMGKNGFAIVNAQAGTVVVNTASPDLMRAVGNFLRQTEANLTRQVTIEAKILVVELNDGYQQGINWSAIGELAANKTITTRVGSMPLGNPDQIGGVFGAAFALNDFNGVLELLKTQGNVQVLSSPRITAMNNQKAVIKVGSDEFFVTHVSTTTTTSSNAAPVTTPEVTLTPFFSGVALDITPQISQDNRIILHVHPSVSEVQDQNKRIDLGFAQLQLPLAFSNIRESDTVVHAEPGRVVVIGGLMQSSSQKTVATTPLLGRIPLIKYLFEQKRSAVRKTELVILLRPMLTESLSTEQFVGLHGARYGLTPADFAGAGMPLPAATAPTAGR
ncbi:MAG: type and secretion system protein [Moraxellaceae bacterium]|jgi:MSHA biogenesis protein MshL|nr:type and secretion system protein [Moraxellaceae bacterium]